MNHPPTPTIMRILLPALLTLIFHSVVHGQDPANAGGERGNKPQVRIICMASLQDEQEIVLATKNDKGEWTELGAAKLRSPIITDWLPAKSGKLSMALRGNEGLAEIGSFTYPADTRRAVVVVYPDTANNRYRSQVFVPDKLGFVQGSTLVINYSKIPGAVAMGSKKTTIEPGQSKVLKPGVEANGMFRMLVAYQDQNQQTIVCHDRYIPLNEESRDILFLLPDPTMGLRVFSLSEFGPFDDPQ